MNTLVTIMIIVDPSFGTQLNALSVNDAVWICGSPANQSAAELSWKLHPEKSITTFQYNELEEPIQVCKNILGDVALHHHDWQIIEVYGAVYAESAKADLVASLEVEFGEKLLNARFDITTSGFKIIRNR